MAAIIDPIAIHGFLWFLFMGKRSLIIPTMCEKSTVDNAFELDTELADPEFINDNVVVDPVVNSNLLLLSFPKLIIIRLLETCDGFT